MIMSILNSFFKWQKIKLEKQHNQLMDKYNSQLLEIKLEQEKQKLENLKHKINKIEINKTYRNKDIFFDILIIEKINHGLNVIYYEYNFLNNKELNNIKSKVFANQHEALIYFGKEHK